MISIKDFAPFIQEYIYKQEWQSLRPIQLDAAEVILNSDENCLIASPTASGKTEAALFPIITKMYNNPKKGIVTLYISPLKALINDQFLRLSESLEKGNIKVFRWHGDVSSYQKEKALNTDNIILQITPESIESLFLNHTSEIPTIFKNLDFVVIDEVHYFLDSSRGIHMMSLIERLEKILNKPIRRIGLSATIGNLENAANFISSKKFSKILTNLQNSTKSNILMLYNNVESISDEKKYYKYIYQLINGRKCIVFANSKKEVEKTAHNLKKINKDINGNNYILVHHGNISKTLRDEVELKMKKEDMPISAVATMTLELGIDLGTLERVIQIDTPLSISSFVQRLGRTGRTNGIKEMCFCFKNELGDDSFSWNFMYAISLISLYIKTRHLEEISIDKYPYSTLVHQTLSVIHNNPGILPKKLASILLTISVFSNITQEDYKLLLNYLIKCELIEVSNNGLYLASEGEQIVNNFEFYSTFKTEKDYEVIFNGKLIGSIQKKLPIGSTFNLAGSSWEIIEVNTKTKTINVKETTKYQDTSWESSGLTIIDDEVMKNLKDILSYKYDFKFLSKSANDKYQECFNVFNQYEFICDYFIQSQNNEFILMPFLGTKNFLTLYYLLNSKFIVKPIFEGFIPLGIKINTNNLYDVLEYINNINEDTEFKFDLNFSKKGKYDEYIPEQLLKKAFKENYLDIKNLKKIFK